VTEIAMPFSTPALGRLIGAGFLAAFLLYGFGTLDSGAPAGRLLMVLNSFAVAGIGAAAFRLLGAARPTTATVYLAGRLLEAALLATGVGFLAAGGQAGNDTLYQVAMLGLALASVPFCLALPALGWVPRWLGWWGVVGYAALAVGSALALLGADVGLWFVLPGGLFEVLFGVLLLARGVPIRAAAGRLVVPVASS
jgi:hypothetical protein